jgi:hypothetical protein
VNSGNNMHQARKVTSADIRKRAYITDYTEEAIHDDQVKGGQICHKKQ